MAIETLIVTTSLTPLDLLLWRAHGREVAGLVESALALNAGLAALGTFLPLGTRVMVDMPAAAPSAAQPAPVIRLFD
jgi:phage tail protein X